MSWNGHCCRESKILPVPFRSWSSTHCTEHVPSRSQEYIQEYPLSALLTSNQPSFPRSGRSDGDGAWHFGRSADSFLDAIDWVLGLDGSDTIERFQRLYRPFGDADERNQDIRNLSDSPSLCFSFLYTVHSRVPGSPLVVKEQILRRCLLSTRVEPHVIGGVGVTCTDAPIP